MTTAAPLVRIYLRASDKKQDAERARETLLAFCLERGLRVAGLYVENASGTSLNRPELFRAISDSQAGDILLAEQIDRISRLSASDWQRLRAEIDSRGIKVVALDLPTSWQMATANVDDFTARMMSAINGMCLDVLAAVSAKDASDRKRRVAEGIVKARAANPSKYKGRPEDSERIARIQKLLQADMSWSDVMAITKASRTTVAKALKRLKEERAA